MAEKTIRTRWNDEKVEVSDDGGSIGLRVYADGRSLGLNLTTEQAEELSRALSAFAEILSPQEAAVE